MSPSGALPRSVANEAAQIAYSEVNILPSARMTVSSIDKTDTKMPLIIPEGAGRIAIIKSRSFQIQRDLTKLSSPARARARLLTSLPTECHEDEEIREDRCYAYALVLLRGFRKPGAGFNGLS